MDDTMDVAERFVSAGKDAATRHSTPSRKIGDQTQERESLLDDEDRREGEPSSYQRDEPEEDVRSESSSSDYLEDECNDFEIEAPEVETDTEDNIQSLLRNLRDSRNVKEATISMKSLADVFGPKAEVHFKKHASQSVVRLDGVTAVLLCIKEWAEKSLIFTDFALRFLIPVTFHIPRAREQLVRAGGIRIILDAAKTHQHYLFVRSNIVCLLGNLAGVEDLDQRSEVATEECIDNVWKTMKTWPEEEYVQKFGCIYFINIGHIDDMTRAKLRSKRIGTILMDAYESTQGFHEEDKSELAALAQRAIQAYIGEK